MIVFRPGVLGGRRSLVHHPVEVVVTYLVLPVTETVFEAASGCNRTLTLQYHDVVQGNDAVLALLALVGNEDHLRINQDATLEAML